MNKVISKQYSIMVGSSCSFPLPHTFDLTRVSSSIKFSTNSAAVLLRFCRSNVRSGHHLRQRPLHPPPVKLPELLLITYSICFLTSAPVTSAVAIVSASPLVVDMETNIKENTKNQK